MVCSFCQRGMPPTALFCDYCGRMLPATGATRPLAPDQRDAATYDPEVVRWLIDRIIEAIAVVQAITPPASMDRLYDAILAAYPRDDAQPSQVRPPSSTPAVAARRGECSAPDRPDTRPH